MTNDFLDYLKFEKRYSPNTIVSYQNDLAQYTKYVEENIGLPIHNLKPMQVRSWIAQLVEEKHKATSVKRKLSAVKTYYKFLQKKGLATSNPAANLQAPKAEERLPKYVEQQQLTTMYEDINTSQLQEQDRMILELLYSTGIRRQELITLQWQDVNFHEKSLKITGKGNKQRLVPVSINTIEKLKKLRILQDNNISSKYIFCQEDGAMLYPNYVYRLVRKYLSSYTTVSKKSPHVLRHSFATHLSNNGAPLNDIKELLGHASLASTQVYTHNSIEQLKEIYKIAHPKS